MTIPPNLAYADATFKATGATTQRSHGDRAADFVNVKDYGATGDGSTDDLAAIQAAIDAAFGTAASPHGYTNRALNKALYFPHTQGGYRITNSLVFTHVYGGLIYGDMSGIAVFGTGSSTTAPTFVINGMVETVIQGLQFYSASTSACNVDLDWNGTWADLPVAGKGLRSNVIAYSLMGTAGMGVRIANSSNDGACNTFLGVNIQATPVGVEILGANAIGNMIIGGGIGGTGSTVGYKMTAGQFSVIQGTSNASCTYFLSVQSNLPVSVLGGRAENCNIVTMSTGNVNVCGMECGNGPVVIANVTGGKCILDCLHIPAGCTATGNGGTIYQRGSVTVPSGFFTGYTGTIAQNI